MKIFIWDRVNQCSDNYHPEGGVAVIAESLQRAVEIANQLNGCNIQKNEMPDDVYEIKSDEEKVFIFPDAGCC